MRTRADEIIEDYQSVLDDVISTGRDQMDWENPTRAVDIRKVIDDFLSREEALMKIEKDVTAEIDNDPVYQARLQAIATYQDDVSARYDAEADEFDTLGDDYEPEVSDDYE